LKNSKDPDEYINKNGIEKFREAVKNAMPATEFKISLIKQQYDTTGADGKILFIDEVVNVFTRIKDAVEVDAYITKVAEDTGISRDAILSKYREKTSKNNFRRIPTKSEYQKKTEVRRREQKKELRASGRLLDAQKRLLGLVSQSKKLYKMVSAQLKPEDFASEVYKRLAQSIYSAYENDLSPEPAMILNEFTGDDISEASEVFYNLEVYSGDEETVKELLYTVKLETLDMRINAETNPAELAELFKAREKLIDEKNTWEE
jgi:DNA primase